MTFTQETLGFRRTGVSPVFSYTHACILTSAVLQRPSRVLLHRQAERSPTHPPPLRGEGANAAASVSGFYSPVELSVHGYSTSELLRTL
jgi:hypothetical protein